VILIEDEEISKFSIILFVFGLFALFFGNPFVGVVLIVFAVFFTYDKRSKAMDKRVNELEDKLEALEKKKGI